MVPVTPATVPDEVSDRGARIPRRVGQARFPRRPTRRTVGGWTEGTERNGSGWPATRWLAAAWLRRRWVAMVPAMLIVAVGTTGTVVALTAAHRTSDAYRAYLDRADVGDVVINPSTNTREIEEAIRTLPGVEQVTSDALFFVTNDDGAPRRRAELGDGSGAVVRGSPDGRYADMDRPAVQSGRLPTGPSEAAVSVEMAEAFDLAVGDVEPLAFWRAVPDLAEGDRIAALLDEVAEPIGVEEVTVVGIVAMPDGVLPDELYPRQTVILSPDLAARYDCVPPTPPSQSSFEVVMATMFPPDCATQYRYYSLSLAGGAAAVKPALEEFVRRSNLLNGQLEDSVDLEDAGLDEPPSYFAITQETQPELLRVERAVRPTVIGLLVLGSAVAVAMLGLFALAVSRELRRTTTDRRQWHQLGVASAAQAFVSRPPHRPRCRGRRGRRHRRRLPPLRGTVGRGRRRRGAVGAPARLPHRRDRHRAARPDSWPWWRCW